MSPKFNRIFIASDHAGFDLKSKLITNIPILYSSLDVKDIGCDNSKESVDYPDFAKKLSFLIDNDNAMGILICGSGIGMSIAANRYSHIRAALCHNCETAKLARNHNNANILCIGARNLDFSNAINIVKQFIEEDFSAGRHQKRVSKLS